MSETNVLRMENVTMQFGGVVAVNDLSLDVPEGQIVALIGPNGAGKTTAFNVISGFYNPQEGDILFKGHSVKGFPPHRICRAGMARTFQNIRLWKTQTVFDNVLIAKHMLRTSNVFSATFRLNRKEEAQHREEVMELLRIVGLEDVKDELATSLPYGKQRRLEIARALATHPKLLMLDEPAAGMNPQETNELTEFIGRIRDEFHMTILLIEHHMDLVMDISDRIYVIDFGELIATGTPEEIQNNQRVIDAYLGVEEDA